MRRYIAILLALLTLSVGCSKLQEIEMGQAELKNFRLLGTSSAEVEVEFGVSNPSNKELTLESAEGFLKREGRNFAQITLLESDTVVANQYSINSVKFKIDILDPLSLLSMGLNVSKWDMSNFLIDARGVVKVSPGRKRRLKFNDMPLDKLVKRL